MNRNCHARTRQKSAHAKSKGGDHKTGKTVRPNGKRKRPSHVWKNLRIS